MLIPILLISNLHDKIGGGFWRRGDKAPTSVKWEDRIIKIREGSWSYVVGSSSIGRSPEKVVGTATPKEPPEGFRAGWSFSTGDELLIQWEKTTSISGMRFDLQNSTSCEPTVKLLQGRHLQYRVKKSNLEIKQGKEERNTEEMKREANSGEDEYVTVVRCSEDDPTGKATALLNWKLLVVELLPEEDAVLALLLCMSILRNVSELKREDIGGILVPRRIREAKSGERDWELVILHPWSYSPSVSSPYVHPWYWNAEAVMASRAKDQAVSQASSSYLHAEGGDRLYKSGIIP